MYSLYIIQCRGGSREPVSEIGRRGFQPVSRREARSGAKEHSRASRSDPEARSRKRAEEPRTLQRKLFPRWVLYTGITTDLARRFAEHKRGTGASYTRSHPPQKIIYSENLPTRSAALKREAEIKSWPREKKMALVKASRAR